MWAHSFLYYNLYVAAACWPRLLESENTLKCAILHSSRLQVVPVLYVETEHCVLPALVVDSAKSGCTGTTITSRP